jgi:hypothetical protein
MVLYSSVVSTVEIEGCGMKKWADKKKERV